ncbi:MAG: hypothetical protein SP4CHLAM5_01570 [Chlamydiia bacterium]|nr:hypothetical protein [Chlamydiia bacterium]MCH9618031.1 hypothetical protein [Chlamydiia bacterium]MCH9623644.1 hypothetical protein [Chlamydiia bacterium]
MSGINSLRGKFWYSSSESSSDDSSSTGSLSSDESSSTGSISEESGSTDSISVESGSTGTVSARSTPTVVGKFFDNIPDTKSDLTLSEDEMVKAVNSSATYEECSTPKRRRLSQRVLSAVVPGYNYQDEKMHRTVMDIFKNDGDWVQDVFAAHESRPIINYDHLLRPDEKGGWHFCSQLDISNGTIKVEATNPSTGVFVGTFNHNGKPKPSSFFPLNMNPERLIGFINESEPRYTKDNRALYYFDAGFYLEVYFKSGGQVVNSAFPILAFYELNSAFNLQLAGCEVTGFDVTMKLIDEQKKEISTVFEDDKHLIVDLAKLYPFENIKSGVYLKINKDDYFLS